MLKNILYSTIWNKCPRCHKTDVFISNNPYDLSQLSKMNDTCSSCGEKYVKEPGGYYGAMYVSYALMVGWYVICWAINYFFLNAEIFTFLVFVTVSIVLFMPITFRISRLLWLNLFIKYNPSKSNLSK